MATLSQMMDSQRTSDTILFASKGRTDEPILYETFTVHIYIYTHMYAVYKLVELSQKASMIIW